MPANPTVSSTDLAQEMLIASARKFRVGTAIIPSRFERLSPTDIYDYLLLNWADHKGNAAIAYGTVGVQVGATLSFDFGVLICPGLVNASVSGTGTYTWADASMLLFHRAFPVRWISIDTRKKIIKKIINKVEKPVVFMVMEGEQSSWSLKLAVAASIGSGSNLGGISDAFPLGCFGFTLAGADLSGQFTSTIYKYKDNRPGFYPNGRDATLLQDFKAALGTRHTHYLKREAVAWLQYVRKEFVQPKTGRKFDNLKQAFKSLPSFRFPGFVASFSAVLDKLDEIFNALDVLPADEKAIIASRLADYREDIAQARAARTEYITPEKAGRERGRSIVDGLCFITLSNRKGQGTLKVSIGNSPADGAMGGGSGVGTNLADGSDKLKAASTFTIPTITLGSGLNASYRYVRTNYRYQTFGFSNVGNRVVLTQDVQIRYHQLEASIAMQAGLDGMVGRDFDLSGIHVMGRDLSRVGKVKAAMLNGKSWLWSSMVYRAVTGYWNYFNNASGTSTDTLNGSGLSFGFAMRMQDLIRLSLEENAGTDANTMTKKVQHYAKMLQVTPDQFRTFVKGFLAGAELDQQKKLEGFERCMEYGAVLVESSFRLQSSAVLQLGKKLDGTTTLAEPEDLTLISQWKNFFHGDSTDAAAAGLELEAIRIRIRLGDHTSNSTNAFRLGLYLFGSGIGFTIDDVEWAGNEGILEIHVHYFIPEDQDISLLSRNLNDSVPPVMLVPHSFNQ